MRTHMRRGLALVAVTAALAVPAVVAGAEEPKVDKAAVDALKGMAAYLGTLKSFDVRATITTEDVLDDGQKLQYEAEARVVARQPDRLLAEIEGEDRNHLYLYNGKDFTLFDRDANVYGTVPAPATTTKLYDDLPRYGIEMPIADLFHFGSDKWNAGQITGARDAGPSVVGGTTCQHYAFRQEGLDWQIWIQKGDHPLPLKMVITTLTDEARPQFTAVYAWNLAPSVNEAAFTFDPPPNAVKARIEQTPAAGASR